MDYLLLFLVRLVLIVVKRIFLVSFGFLCSFSRGFFIFEDLCFRCKRFLAWCMLPHVARSTLYMSAVREKKSMDETVALIDMYTMYVCMHVKMMTLLIVLSLSL